MLDRRLYGVLLAGFGVLVLTPDALFMRLSGMSGFQMVAWRGLLMGGGMLGAWLLVSRERRRDLALLCSGSGVAVAVCQILNVNLFALGIGNAPVSMVLFGLASVPVCSALLSRILLGEPTRPATWAAIAAVLTGIGIAVLGGKAGQFSLNLEALTGAMAGLGVAVVLALNFVLLRARPDLPVLLLIGSGAGAGGVIGLLATGPAQMGQGAVWAIAICGALILPVSFFCMSQAARHTQASNVSLLLLLETVLGPLWVWLGVGEAPTPAMLTGGVIVVGSLALYLLHMGRGRR